MRRARRAAGVLVALALAAGCAPRPTGIAPVTGGARGARYLSRLVERERRAAMVEAAGTLWARGVSVCDTCPRRRLPGVQVDLALAWPDAVRLRAGAWFGTALDVGLRGDSITAWSPLQRAGAVLDARADSLGVRDPGRLAVRLLAAAWRPPASSWDSGTPLGDLLLLRWEEDGDSVAVAVDAVGRPAWARMWRGASRGVRVDYERWQFADGVDWPVTLRVAATDGGADLTARFDRVTFERAPDPAKLEVTLPEDADRLEPGRLARLLGLLGGRR